MIFIMFLSFTDYLFDVQDDNSALEFTLLAFKCYDVDH